MDYRVGDYLILKREENSKDIILLGNIADDSWLEKKTIAFELSSSLVTVEVIDINAKDGQMLVNYCEDNKVYSVIKLDGKYETYPRIGDKVKIKNQNYFLEVKYIRKSENNLPSIAGECSKKIPMGHDCGGFCQEGKGRWFFFSDVEEVIRKDIDRDVQVNELTKEVKKLTQELKKKDKVQDLLTGAIIDKAKDIAVDDLKEHLREKIDEYIENEYGALPKKVIIENKTEIKEMQGIFHKQFENICKIVAKNIPLMLVGSAGAGKNYTLEQVAEALDLKFYFSNAVNQEYKLTGFIDANGTYHETEFYKAFTNGGMFFLDEIDASCAECLVILNSAIANKYFDFPTGRVKAHKDFRVVCAGNTYGTGADMVYVGRNVLDGATLDRFVVLQFDYDDEVEKALAYDNELYLFVKDLRKAINDSGLRYIVSMRALINSSKLLEIGVPKIDILKTSIIKNMQIDDINNIVDKLRNGIYDDWKAGLRSLSDVKD